MRSRTSVASGLMLASALVFGAFEAAQARGVFRQADCPEQGQLVCYFTRRTSELQHLLRDPRRWVFLRLRRRGLGAATLAAGLRLRVT